MRTQQPRRRSRNQKVRQPGLNPIEHLEDRQLLAYTPLGFSIPDLAIVGASSGPVGALGGSLAVVLEVANYGQSSLPEPINQFPTAVLGAPPLGSESSADADDSEVGVFLSPRANTPLGQQLFLGSITVPKIPQNDLIEVSSILPLPPTVPPGFPVTGQDAFLTFVIDPAREVPDLDRTNNILRSNTSVLLVPPLPEFSAVALALPPTLNPGDTILPSVTVANLGAAFNFPGPVLTFLVASQDPFFGPGDVVVDDFEIPLIPPLSLAPSELNVVGDVNLTNPDNFVTVTSTTPVRLPDLGSPYFLGVIVDPFDTILEISEIDALADPTLELVEVVVNSGVDLPPAGPLATPAIPPLPFPLPPFVTPTGTPTAAGFVPPIAPQPPGSMSRNSDWNAEDGPRDRAASLREQWNARREAARARWLGRLGL